MLLSKIIIYNVLLVKININLHMYMQLAYQIVQHFRRHACLMVLAVLQFRWVHCVVFLGSQALYSHIVSLHPGVWRGTTGLPQSGKITKLFFSRSGKSQGVLHKARECPYPYTKSMESRGIFFLKLQQIFMKYMSHIKFYMQIIFDYQVFSYMYMQAKQFCFN